MVRAWVTGDTERLKVEDGAPIAFIVGCIVAAFIAAQCHHDYVTADQYLAAEARCAGYGGVTKVEAVIQWVNGTQRVIYFCADGSKGETKTRVGQD